MENTQYVLYYCYAGCYSCSIKTFATLKERKDWYMKRLPVLRAWGIDEKSFSHRLENKDNQHQLMQLQECCEHYKIHYIVERFLKENNLEW